MNNNINKNNKVFEVDRNILFFSFRYALGRMSYAPSVVIDNIKCNLDKLPNNEIECYIKEIDEFENYGMDCDIKTWTNFSAFLKNELKDRNSKQKSTKQLV